uniref:Uncharacterized protein n=1 Tax=Rhipicephalus zambeziensis TaxID=60191 RepID=A0A224YLI8_9ACAR
MQFHLSKHFYLLENTFKFFGHPLHSECDAHCVIYFTASTTMKITTLTFMQSAMDLNMIYSANNCISASFSTSRTYVNMPSKWRRQSRGRQKHQLN